MPLALHGRCVVSCFDEVLTEITSVFIGLISTTLAWYGSSLHTGALSLMSRMVIFTWPKSAWKKELVKKELILMQSHILSPALVLIKPILITFHWQTGKRKFGIRSMVKSAAGKLLPWQFQSSAGDQPPHPQLWLSGYTQISAPDLAEL